MLSGFNGDLVTTVWIGHDGQVSKSLKGAGSRVALPIWVKFMSKALAKNQMPIEEPDNIERVRINRDTGMPVKGDLSNSMLEIFNKNNLPITKIEEEKGIEEEEESMRDTLF